MDDLSDLTSPIKQRVSISVCTYQNGDFDVIIEDPDTGREVTLSGIQKMDDHDLLLLNDVAPACVMTTYERTKDT